MSMAAAMPRPKARQAPRFGRLRLITLAVLVVLAALLTLAWFAVRGSSLVAVEQVKVVGLSGHYDKAARRAVIAEAQSMTTMQFDASRVEQAAAQFVDVAGVEVETSYPHGVTLRFDVRRPVVEARVGGRSVILSQDGEVITPSHAVPGLVKIDVPGTVDGDRVRSRRAQEAVGVLGAAPDVLLRKVESVHWGKLGIVASLRQGPDLYFGDADDARLKWADAVAVLASEKSRGAAYLDLRVPGRVAVGGLGGAALPQGSTAAVAEPGASGGAVQGTTSPGATTAPPVATPQPQQTTPQQAPATGQQMAPAPQQAPAAAGGAAPGQ
jgi:cell division protein FtsQ